MITDQQIRALVFLAKDCRPTGARQWSEDAIFAEVAKLRGRSLSSVVLAVIRAASDKGAQRPEVIGSPGSHWNDTMLARDYVPESAPVGTRCTVCGYAEWQCRINNDHPYSQPRERMDPDANHAAADTARAELAPMSGPTQPLSREDFAAKNPGLHANLERVRAEIVPDAVTREAE